VCCGGMLSNWMMFFSFDATTQPQPENTKPQQKTKNNKANKKKSVTLFFVIFF
jgi:hypothetical protein